MYGQRMGFFYRLSLSAPGRCVRCTKTGRTILIKGLLGIFQFFLVQGRWSKCRLVGSVVSTIDNPDTVGLQVQPKAMIRHSKQVLQPMCHSSMIRPNRFCQCPHFQSCSARKLRRRGFRVSYQTGRPVRSLSNIRVLSV